MESEVPKETSPVVVVSQTQAERKPFRLNKWHVITVVLVAVIVLQGFLYLSLNSRYDTLNANHKSLTSEHQNLTSDYDTLTNQYSTLQSELSELQSTYDSLETSYSSLQANYSSLQSSYSSLQSDHNSYVSSYNNLVTQVNNRAFGTDGTFFITPQDPTVNNLVMQVTGGWSNRSDWNECWTDTKLMYDWVVNSIEYRYDWVVSSAALHTIRQYRI